jgi:hypothetical protein
MTHIIYHEYEKLDKKHIHHSYLIDVGEEIEIQQVMEYKWKVFDSVILKPPHPKTRYFELIIRELVDSDHSLIDDMQVYPVSAKRKPDLTFLGLRIKRGDWTISERIYKKENTTEIQWIYTDDFHLFAITHATDPLDVLVEQIVAKIDEIATSIRSGFRIHSHMENQQMRREAFDSVIESHNGITINKTAILKHPEFRSGVLTRSLQNWKFPKKPISAGSSPILKNCRTSAGSLNERPYRGKYSFLPGM